MPVLGNHHDFRWGSKAWLSVHHPGGWDQFISIILGMRPTQNSRGSNTYSRWVRMLLLVTVCNSHHQDDNILRLRIFFKTSICHCCWYAFYDKKYIPSQVSKLPSIPPFVSSQASVFLANLLPIFQTSSLGASNHAAPATVQRVQQHLPPGKIRRSHQPPAWHRVGKTLKRKSWDRSSPKKMAIHSDSTELYTVETQRKKALLIQKFPDKVSHPTFPTQPKTTKKNKLS